METQTDSKPDVKVDVTEREFVAVANEWWRQYTDAPEEFQATADTVNEVLAARADGREPTIGERNLVFFKKLLEKIRGAK